MTPQEKLELKEFLQQLYDDSDTTILTVIDDKGKERKGKVKSQKELTGIKEIYSAVLKTNQQKLGGICLTPNPVQKGLPRKIENMSKLNAIFVDIDASQLDLTGVPAPHYVFQRTEKNFHLYWLIERLENTERNRRAYQQIAVRLINKLGGDPSVKDVSRILRTPFTYYLKGGSDSGYSLHTKNDLPRYQLMDLKVSAVGENEIEKYILEQKPTRVLGGEGRSRVLYFFGLDCYSWGISLERALELAEEYNHKHCDPPEPLRVVRHQIKSAYKYAKGALGEFLFLSDEKSPAKAKEQFEEDVRLRNRLTDYVYVEEAERLINVRTGLELTTNASVITHLATLSRKSYSWRQVVQKELVKVVNRMDFRPDKRSSNGKVKTFYREGRLTYFNRYLGLKPVRGTYSELPVKIFLKHIEYLTTNEVECKHLLDYLAFCVQNPGKKINHAVLLISQYEGIGKSLLERLFKQVLLSPLKQSYITTIENTQLMSNWTDFMSGKLLCFIHELAQGDKYATMNRLKSLITEETVHIDQKYAKPYNVRNTVNFIFFSNLDDAIKIGQNDRRLFVVYNNRKPQDAEYYDRLYKTFTEDYFSIYQWLCERDLSGFDANARPPETEGKQQLREQSESELSIYLRALPGDPDSPMANKCFTLTDLQQYVELTGSQLVRNKVSMKALASWMRTNDYEVTEIDKRVKGNRVRVKLYHRTGVILKETDIAKVVSG